MDNVEEYKKFIDELGFCDYKERPDDKEFLEIGFKLTKKFYLLKSNANQRISNGTEQAYSDISKALVEARDKLNEMAVVLTDTFNKKNIAPQNPV